MRPFNKLEEKKLMFMPCGFQRSSKEREKKKDDTTTKKQTIIFFE